MATLNDNNEHDFSGSLEKANVHGKYFTSNYWNVKNVFVVLLAMSKSDSIFFCSRSFERSRKNVQVFSIEIINSPFPELRKDEKVGEGFK
jgi:hypothetical protein